ncbi:MAG: hypothetical protein ACJA13_000693 [Paraglaciecola sp.]
MTLFKHKNIRFFTTMLLSAAVLLAGCNSTGRRTSNEPLLVGPSPMSENSLPDNKRLSTAKVFLDVAIPTFSPGFPIDGRTGEIDFKELDEEGIWPQLRRTEAKLFAAEMKSALDDEKVFGSVSVTPDSSTPSDLFVLGYIDESTSEEVRISIKVLDSSGEIIGKKSFTHTVSNGFFRDQTNQGKNPYGPVFQQASDYIVSLLTDMSDDYKNDIKTMSLMRYARYYAPEVFGQYITSSVKRKNGDRFYKFELVGMPDREDPMLKRIGELRAQEFLFVDRLQDNYEVFQAETKLAYSTWQEETLPEIIAARQARIERNTKAVLGVGAAILAGIFVAKSSKKSQQGNSSASGANSAAAVLAGFGSVWAITDAFKNNARMKVHSAVIDEQGQALDLSVSPMVLEFESQSVELSGTAQEQYFQWKRHLRKIFSEEATPSIQL